LDESLLACLLSLLLLVGSKNWIAPPPMTVSSLLTEFFCCCAARAIPGHQVLMLQKPSMVLLASSESSSTISEKENDPNTNRTLSTAKATTNLVTCTRRRTLTPPKTLLRRPTSIINHQATIKTSSTVPSTTKPQNGFLAHAQLNYNNINNHDNIKKNHHIHLNGSINHFEYQVQQQQQQQEWLKVLYLKQGVPDNFVPVTFLQDLRKNGKILQLSYNKSFKMETSFILHFSKSRKVSPTGLDPRHRCLKSADHLNCDIDLDVYIPGLVWPLESNHFTVVHFDTTHHRLSLLIYYVYFT